jgi:hypothetical protein
MIYLIWYPSGGFGHFVNASLMSLLGIMPEKSGFISSSGDSHAIKSTLGFFTNQSAMSDSYSSPQTLLVDNGITDENINFHDVLSRKDVVPIKITYDDRFWPVIAKTSIVKAQRTRLDEELGDISQWGGDSGDWVIREKYLLYLKHHYFRTMWKPDDRFKNFNAHSLVNYDSFINEIQSLTGISGDLRELHAEMMQKNENFFAAAAIGQRVVESIKDGRHFDLSAINDLWDQAVINFYVETCFDVILPAYDTRAWFHNTEDITPYLTNTVK